MNLMNGMFSEPGRSPDLGIRPGEEALTLAWAYGRERLQVISLAASEGRQTMNLRTMPGAKLVVLRRPQGGFAGWAGMDADSDPKRPELFSQYVYPEYRGRGLGALLDHVWWAYLDGRGCATAYMRMELDSKGDLFQRRRASGYCRQISPEELGRKFVQACRHCELFGDPCRRQAFLAVDVQRALAASTRARGPLDIEALPIQVLPMSAETIRGWQ
jgi:GNAT superfamily N-acetyltransferase